MKPSDMNQEPAPVAQEFDRPAAMDAFEEWADATAPDSKSTSLEKARLAREVARLMGVAPAPVAQGAARAPAEPADCEYCAGSGSVMVMHGRGPDTYEQAEDCPVCDGGGEVTQKLHALPMSSEDRFWAAAAEISEKILAAGGDGRAFCDGIDKLTNALLHPPAAATAPVAQPLTDEQLECAVSAWFEGAAPPGCAGPKFRARLRAAIDAVTKEGGAARAAPAPVAQQAELQSAIAQVEDLMRLHPAPAALLWSRLKLLSKTVAEAAAKEGGPA